MEKKYLKRLFPHVEEHQLAIPYFNFTEKTRDTVSELRSGVLYSQSKRYQSRGVPNYPLYRPTAIANYPTIINFIAQQSLDTYEVL